MKALYLLFFCALSLGAKAQSNSPILEQTITWSVDSLKDVANNQTMLFSCQFKSMTTEKISWIQQNGNYTIDFVINAVSGNWADVAGDGSLEYSVTHNDKSGTIRIESVSGKKTIAFNFPEAGVNSMPYIFEIVTFTQN